MKEKNSCPSIAGIIFSPDREKVLLVKRRDVPVWVLPGGGVEKGETPQLAVIREIFEETGYTSHLLRLVGKYHPINRLAKYTLLYECSIEKGEAKISDETQGIKFFSIFRLPKLLPPPYGEWINDAYINKKEVIEKTLYSITYFSLLKIFFLHPILVIRFLLTKIGLTIND